MDTGEAIMLVLSALATLVLIGLSMVSDPLSAGYRILRPAVESEKNISELT